MKLPANVKPKNFLLNLFPFSKYTAQAIYPNIYFRKEVFKNLKSSRPEPRYIAALKHEQTHIERQKKTGWIKWGLKYIFLPKFRFNEELEAIKASMKYLKKQKLSFHTERVAKYLSSWLYLWCISYKKAKFKLDKLWQEI